MGVGRALWAVGIGVVVAGGGCGGGGTSLLVDVALGDAAPAPSSLRVTLYGPRLVAAPSTIALQGRSLPGTLLIAPLDANAPDFRLLVDGLDGAGAVTSQGFARPSLVPNAQATADVTLAAPAADSDGDGVPDAIDDCPAAADPNQDCAAIDLSLPPANDFSSPDFSTGAVDLAAIDHGAPPSDLLAALACPASTFFCEGFEGGLGAWSVTTLNGGNTASDNTKFPYHGTHALDAISVSQASNSQAAVEHAFTATASVAARAFVYSPAALGNYGLAVQLYGGNLDHAVSVGEDSFGNWILTEYLNGPTNDHASSLAYQTAHWACVEIVVSTSGGQQRVQAWIDSQPLTDFMPAATVNYDLLIVGYGRVPANTASEVFVDDVALGTQRIGCE